MLSLPFSYHLWGEPQQPRHPTILLGGYKEYLLALILKLQHQNCTALVVECGEAAQDVPEGIPFSRSEQWVPPFEVVDVEAVEAGLPVPTFVEPGPSDSHPGSVLVGLTSAEPCSSDSYSGFVLEGLTFVASESSGSYSGFVLEGLTFFAVGSSGSYVGADEILHHRNELFLGLVAAYSSHDVK